MQNENNIQVFFASKLHKDDIINQIFIKVIPARSFFNEIQYQNDIAKIIFNEANFNAIFFFL
jgi:hypothetical protein